MAKSERKTDEDIKALLQHEITSARDYDLSELAAKRARAIEYYNGDMKDTPSLDGRSSVVSRDTSDIIGWMLPGIMRTFMASGRIVEYEPSDEDDEEKADQASEYINYLFMKDNDGYRVMYNATHDALLQGNGIVKHYWEKSEETEVVKYTGLTEDQVAMLLGTVEPEKEDLGEAEEKTSPESADSGPKVQILEQVETVHTDIQTGQPFSLFDIRAAVTRTAGTLKVEVIPPERFLMNKNAITLDDFRFCCHYDDTKTRSDLIEMGYDRDVIEALSNYGDRRDEEEKLARDEDRADILGSLDDAAVVIPIYECYAKIDVNGDGITETIRAIYAGEGGNGQLLEWEEWEDDVPFTDIPCEPVPHRWDARSLADQTMDLQRIKTVLNRQMLDNTYQHGAPNPVVEEGSILNPDALIHRKFGAPIMKKRGSPPIQWTDTPFIGGELLGVVQYIDQVIEKRTGVSRSTMALDPDALQNQTATAVQKAADSAYSKQELLARNMAELGWKRVFRKLLGLVVKHQDWTRRIRIGSGEWKNMDPREWNADMDCTVNVGLGTGSRDRDMAMLNQVLQSQVALADRLSGYAQLSPTFAKKALGMLPKIIDSMTRIGESAGLRNADDYYVKVTNEELVAIEQEMAQAQQAQGQQQDPRIVLEQAKMQMKAQSDQAKMQMDMQKAAADAQIKDEAARQENERRDKELAADLVRKDQELHADLAREWFQMEQELAMARDQEAMRAAYGSVVQPVRVGGAPG